MNSVGGLKEISRSLNKTIIKYGWDTELTMIKSIVHVVIYRSLMAVALLSVGGCQCISPVIVKEAPPPPSEIIRLDAEPIVWDFAHSDDIRVKNVSTRGDVVELLFDDYVFPPSGAGLAPTISVSTTIHTPAVSNKRVLYIQIRGQLQRPKDGTVRLSSSVGNILQAYDVSGTTATASNSMTASSLAPFPAATGDVRPVGFTLAYQQTMPKSGAVPIKLSLSAVCGAGSTAAIQVTSMTITAAPGR